MNKKHKIAVLIILLLLLLCYISKNLDSFTNITIVNFFYFAILFPLATLFLCINGLILKYLLIPFEIRLNFKEWLGLSAITSFANLITPFRGGAFARAVYLKNSYDFSYSLFLSTLAGIYVVNLFTHGFTGIVLILLLKLFHNCFNTTLFLFFTVLCITFLSIIIICPKFNSTKHRQLNKAIEVINGFSAIKKNMSIILLIIGSTLLNISIVGTMIYFEFKAIGYKAEFLPSMLISTISSLTLFINITPGSLGIKESAMAFSALITNLSISHTLAAALLDRLIHSLTICTLGPLFSYILFRKHKSPIEASH